MEKREYCVGMDCLKIVSMLMIVCLHILGIHMFFYLYLFKGLVYVVRYPLAILVLMLVICIGCSYVINMLLQPVNKKITNWIK